MRSYIFNVTVMKFGQVIDEFINSLYTISFKIIILLGFNRFYSFINFSIDSCTYQELYASISMNHRGSKKKQKYGFIIFDCNADHNSWLDYLEHGEYFK